MGRPAKPWHRTADGWWYATIRGRRERLLEGERNARDEARAYKVFHRRLDAPPEEEARAGLTLLGLADQFADSRVGRVRPDTLATYDRHLPPFVAFVGPMTLASAVSPEDVKRWLASRSWGPSTRRLVISVLKTLFAWGLAEGLISVNPLAGVKRPPGRAREGAMEAATLAKILEASRDRAFKDILAFMFETGCRPSEAMAVEARHVDLARAVVTMKSKTSWQSGKDRVIHLTPRALGLCRELAEAHPEGPLFRNTEGNPWNTQALACRFYRLRKRLGLPRGTCPETIRHGWITDALVAGVPIATVAILAGHEGTDKVARVYSKLRDRPEHLKGELGKARPG